MRRAGIWLAAALACTCAACGGGTVTATTHVPVPHRHLADSAPRRLVERVTSSLPAPLQDPSSASLGAHVLLLGGLTGADASTGAILLAGAGGAHQIGSLPSARHDTAAARIGGSVYLFG